MSPRIRATATRPRRPERGDEAGIGLVEIIVAMMLLAVLSLAVLPAIMSAVSGSVTNKDVAVATTTANQRLGAIRAEFSTGATDTSCADLAGHYAGTTPDPAVPGEPQVTTVVDACPSGDTAYPTSVTVTVSVTNAGTTLVTIPTKVMVAKP